MTIKKKLLDIPLLLWVLFIGMIISFEKENFNAILIVLGIIILITLFDYYIDVVDLIKIDDWGITCNKGKDNVSWDEIKSMKLKRHGYWMGARNYHIAYKLIIKKKNDGIVEIEDLENFLYIPHVIKFIIKKYSKIDYFKAES